MVLHPRNSRVAILALYVAQSVLAGKRLRAIYGPFSDLGNRLCGERFQQVHPITLIRSSSDMAVACRAK